MKPYFNFFIAKFSHKEVFVEVSNLQLLPKNIFVSECNSSCPPYIKAHINFHPMLRFLLPKDLVTSLTALRCQRFSIRNMHKVPTS